MRTQGLKDCGKPEVGAEPYEGRQQRVAFSATCKDRWRDDVDEVWQESQLVKEREKSGFTS